MDHPHVCIYTIKYDLQEEKKKIYFPLPGEYYNSVLIHDGCLTELCVDNTSLLTKTSCPTMTCILQIPVLKWWKGILYPAWWLAKYSFPFLTKYTDPHPTFWGMLRSQFSTALQLLTDYLLLQDLCHCVFPWKENANPI